MYMQILLRTFKDEAGGGRGARIRQTPVQVFNSQLHAKIGGVDWFTSVGVAFTHTHPQTNTS